MSLELNETVLERSGLPKVRPSACHKSIREICKRAKKFPGNTQVAALGSSILKLVYIEAISCRESS